MKNKEDIGTLLEKKLHGVKKTPSTALWDRVDATLNKKDKRRKRILWFWVGSGIFTLIITVLYGVNIGMFSENMLETQEDKSTIEYSIKTSKETRKTNEITDNVLKASGENLKNEKLKPGEATQGLNHDMDNVKKTISYKFNSYQSPKENNLELQKNSSLSKKEGSMSSKKKHNESKIIDEGYKVKTTYYYYNGESEQQITTTNKKTIDSLLNIVENLTDTLNTDKKFIFEGIKIKDSLNR